MRLHRIVPVALNSDLAGGLGVFDLPDFGDLIHFVFRDTHHMEHASTTDTLGPATQRLS